MQFIFTRKLFFLEKQMLFSNIISDLFLKIKNIWLPDFAAVSDVSYVTFILHNLALAIDKLTR